MYVCLSEAIPKYSTVQSSNRISQYNYDYSTYALVP